MNLPCNLSLSHLFERHVSDALMQLLIIGGMQEYSDAFETCKVIGSEIIILLILFWAVFEKFVQFSNKEKRRFNNTVLDDCQMARLSFGMTELRFNVNPPHKVG